MALFFFFFVAPRVSPVDRVSSLFLLRISRPWPVDKQQKRPHGFVALGLETSRFCRRRPHPPHARSLTNCLRAATRRVAAVSSMAFVCGFSKRLGFAAESIRDAVNRAPHIKRQKTDHARE
ncbi:hypothetical protein pdul_cds_667 [Pandoravirus dulcis]|uniref:Uncharacterized protein n=1 Tax=Pandoravirus dulcis TaxID=1349409 RepID=S4VY41_9VIRU|nr:hypothetical protein pdul_cds_667 [Pandoravirus dulcis]AGO82814.1 hypothetical protein pdul_cds_667 [Pandoravirus dulcis]